MSGYTDTIRRWAIDTRRAGTLPEADGIGEVGLGADEAGRRLAVRFTLRTSNDRVDDIRYQVFGCGFTIAACAMAAEQANGCRLEDVAVMTARQIDTWLGGLPAEREYCADLAVKALHAAVASARGSHQVVQHAHAPSEEHDPRVTSDHPVYRRLMDSPPAKGIAPEDRHLFACLLAVASDESPDLAEALGLVRSDLVALLGICFPARSPFQLQQAGKGETQSVPERNGEILSLLLAHVPRGPRGQRPQLSVLFAQILAARAAHPGHLWLAMGLFERPELTAAIRRLLPSLAAANEQGAMRWKRFLFKQLCDQNGGVMCKVPDCGQCSDYALCFVENA